MTLAAQSKVINLLESIGKKLSEITFTDDLEDVAYIAARAKMELSEVIWQIKHERGNDNKIAN